jgi:glucosyl-dolichyl phosphate glucuronosyltransferase
MSNSQSADKKIERIRMSVSVIICTFNRCEMLARALDSVAASAVPDTVEWEVLVVDNNSTDQTRDVVQDFRRRYPGRFRYLLEPEQGLSHARNAGIRESQGDVLVFTDDDVTVDSPWLRNLTTALQDREWAGTGGRIIPVWSCPPPRWLRIHRPRVIGCFVAFDRGSEAGPLTEPPFGANMAYRKVMFTKYGGFRTDLGRCGQNMIGNEEIEFAQRLLTAGERLRYEPSAVVHHPVLEDRLTKEYHLAWWFGQARSDVKMSGVLPGTKLLLCGVPFYLFRRLARWTVQWLVSVRPANRFYCKLIAWGLAGEIFERYQRSRSGHGDSIAVAELQCENAAFQRHKSDSRLSKQDT